MFTRALTKPDGRRLLLYSRRPIGERLIAPSPSSEPAFPNAHFRWPRPARRRHRDDVGHD